MLLLAHLLETCSTAVVARAKISYPEPNNPPNRLPTTSLPQALARQAFLSQAGTLPGLANVTRWVLAGHSMGARVAASIASDPDWRQQTVAAILSSYPLHPPRRPQELRDALLHALQLPTLLVRGVRDPFSQQALWDAALEGMQGACAWRQHTVLGGDHGLRISGTGGAAKSQEALEGVCAAVQDFIREVQQEQQQPQQAAAAVAAAAAGGGRRSYSRTASQPRVARGSQQTKRRSSDGGGRGPGSKRQRR